MKYKLFAFISIITFAACNANNFIKTTGVEDKAVQKVVDYYGGKYEYGATLQLSTDGSKHTYFDLKIIGCPEIGDPKTDNIVTAGIAYTFYCSLKMEANAFDQIRTEIVDSNGKSKVFSYDVNELQKVKS